MWLFGRLLIPRSRISARRVCAPRVCRVAIESLEDRLPLAVGTLSIADASLLEGDFGNSNMKLAATRTGDLSKTLIVGYTTNGTTATAGSDFLSTPGSATFAAGSATATINVPIIGDLAFEPNETLSVDLTGVLVATGQSQVFLPKQDFATGNLPIFVVAADFNTDGRADLVAVDSGVNLISVLLNTTPAATSSISFAAKRDFATALSPVAVAAGDINGDNRPDLVVANSGSNSISVFVNTTASGATIPTFAARQDFSTPLYPNYLAIDDLNGDGKVDVVVANTDGNSVSLFRNLTATAATAASFAARQDIATLAGPASVAVGDLNGDALPDLCIVNSLADSVSTFISTTAVGATTFSFNARQDFAVGTNPADVAIADLNGDGLLDLAVANFMADSVSLLLNATGLGAASVVFPSRQDVGTGAAPVSIEVGDFSGSGRLDLAIALADADSISFFQNNTQSGAGAISLGELRTFATGTSPYSLASSDFDNDGTPDLAVANYYSDSASVLLNANLSVTRGHAVGTILNDDTSNGIQVVGRHLFYNNSAFDGANSAANAADDAAIAPTPDQVADPRQGKTALLPGQTASFQNYSSYSRGLNGIMVDIVGRPNTSIAANDFDFRVGNDNTPGVWPLAPAPTTLASRPAEGDGASERITLVWPDGAIKNQWLQITIKATAATGLLQPAVFYFGSAVGEVGNATSNALVNATDEISARSNPRTFNDPAPISNLQDFNRDRFVNATDQILARSNTTTLVNSLKLIQPPSSLSGQQAFSVVLPAKSTSNEQPDTHLESPAIQLAENLVDLALLDAGTSIQYEQSATSVSLYKSPRKPQATTIADSLDGLLIDWNQGKT